MEEESQSLLDYFIVLVNWRWLFIRNIGLAAILSLIISLIWPKTYRSEAIIIPAKTVSAGGYASLFTGGVNLNAEGKSQIVAENFETIINSVKLRRRLVKRFNLYDYYDIEYFESMMKRLNDVIEIEKGLSGGLGYITINYLKVIVYDKDPRLAAEMNRFVIDELDSIISDINRKRAEHLREFIEDRRNKVLSDLRSAQNKLKFFQEKTGLYSVKMQVQQVVNNLANIEAQIKQKEFEKELYLFGRGNDFVAIKMLNKELKILKNEYQELKKGKLQVDNNLLIPFDELPELTLEYANLEREVILQSKLLEGIEPQYEKFLMQENNNVPSFNVLDYPRIPDYKYKPKRILIIITGILLSFIFSWLYVFFMEYYKRTELSDGAEYEKLKQITNAFKSNFFGYKKSRKNRV